MGNHPQMAARFRLVNYDNLPKGFINPPGNQHTVDGCEILHQLIGGKQPMIYRLSTIQAGVGFRNHTL